MEKVQKSLSTGNGRDKRFSVVVEFFRFIVGSLANFIQLFHHVAYRKSIGDDCNGRADSCLGRTNNQFRQVTNQCDDVAAGDVHVNIQHTLYLVSITCRQCAAVHKLFGALRNCDVRGEAACLASLDDLRRPRKVDRRDVLVDGRCKQFAYQRDCIFSAPSMCVGGQAKPDLQHRQESEKLYFEKA